MKKFINAGPEIIRFRNCINISRIM